jgi:hypothetical protein
MLRRVLKSKSKINKKSKLKKIKFNLFNLLKRDK